MKLSVYYESNRKRDYTWLETEDNSVNVMIERDYQKRLENAKDGESIARRDPQTILNEEISKPTYNSHHKDTRRHASFDKLESTGGLACDSKIARPKSKTGKEHVKAHHFLNRQKTLEEEVFGSEEDELYAALAELPADQYKLLMDVYADDVDQRVIADKAGVSESAISHRKDRALARLKKEMEKIRKKSE